MEGTVAWGHGMAWAASGGGWALAAFLGHGCMALLAMCLSVYAAGGEVCATACGLQLVA
jgi:hypothetical protein